MGEFEQRASMAGGLGASQECMTASFFTSEGGGINDVLMRSWYKGS